MAAVVACGRGPAATGAGVQAIVSTADGARSLASEAELPLEPVRDVTEPVVRIDPAVRGQSILGLGASFDHASCENLAKLSPERRQEVLEKLFHPVKGIGMNLMRVCIGTSDFTGVPYYTYDDVPEGETDPDLTKFSIAADREQVIPAIRAAREVNPDLVLYASPWSPPAWMKKPSRLGGGAVEPRWYPAYARYLLEFVRAYEREGLPIHAITVQNEPHMTHRGYPTTAWRAEGQRDFIRDHLGPLFEREGVATKIWCWDHNWNEPEFPRTILADPKAASAIAGCFQGEATAFTLRIVFPLSLYAFVVITVLVLRRQLRRASSTRATEGGAIETPTSRLILDACGPADGPVGRVVELEREIVIGRRPPCDVLVLDDAVSSQHAQFVPDIGTEWLVIDLGSTNGTKVNGTRIEIGRAHV